MTWWVDEDERFDETPAPKRVAITEAGTAALAVAPAPGRDPLILVLTQLVEQNKAQYEATLVQIKVLEAKISLQGNTIGTLEKMLDGLGKRVVAFIKGCDITS